MAILREVDRFQIAGLRCRTLAPAAAENVPSKPTYNVETPPD